MVYDRYCKNYERAVDLYQEMMKVVPLLGGGNCGFVVVSLFPGFSLCSHSTSNRNHFLRMQWKSSARRWFFACRRVFADSCEQKQWTLRVGNLLMSDFLIKPVQRICKYPLLFKVCLHREERTKGERTHALHPTRH